MNYNAATCQLSPATLGTISYYYYVNIQWAATNRASVSLVRNWAWRTRVIDEMMIVSVDHLWVASDTCTWKHSNGYLNHGRKRFFSNPKLRNFLVLYRWNDLDQTSYGEGRVGFSRGLSTILQKGGLPSQAIGYSRFWKGWFLHHLNRVHI